MRNQAISADDVGCCETDTETSRGTLTVICGCMFSGKTTELLRRLELLPHARTLCFKHEIDRRYAVDAIVSHGGLAAPATMIHSANELLTCCNDRIDLVALDEAHFFTDSLVDAVRELTSRGTNVMVTSLDRDSWGRPFRVADALLGAADERIIKAATCARCGSRADLTQRLTPILNGNMVGGSESYEPRCRKCWSPPPEPPPA